ncbi:MAG: AAA family ATPase [Erysipelotrichaceae bacterium]|nr:AAA family ATPase [Erysipelotrichaceae bacterium]
MPDNNKIKETKDELMQKVYGPGAPDRSLKKEDYEILKNNDLKLEDLSEEWRAIKENSDRIQQAAEKIMNTDLDALRYNLQKDFADVFPVDEANDSLTIAIGQSDLADKFSKIEAEMNKQILCQKDYISDLLIAFRRPLVQGQQSSGLNNSILISGQIYTGRHSSMNLLSELLVKYEVMPKADIRTIDLSLYTGKENEDTFIQDLYGAINNAEIILFDNIEKTGNAYIPYLEEIITTGALNLNKRYVMNNKQLVETNNTLVKDSFKTLYFKGKFIVFITALSVKKLLNIVGTRFINTCADIVVSCDITKSNVSDIYLQKEKEFITKCFSKLNITVLNDESLVTYIVDNFLDSQNVGFVNSTLLRWYDALAQYKLKNPTDEILNVSLYARDNVVYMKLPEQEEISLESLLPKVVSVASEDVKKELDDIVGLEKIKNYILSLQDFYAAQKLREKQGFAVSEVSKHMIFTGNPGTGKTTIARLLAKYLKSIDVLSNGQLVEVSRNDLVGKYVGHTAPQTMQVIKSAIGGVLFIDEAYSLYRGQNDSFGLEAIDTLVKAMEDNRDDLIVILAGYTREMKDFLESNSGLKSRFPNVIEFPDYTGEELYEIAVVTAKGKGYKIDEGAREKVTAYFCEVQAISSARSGNGRLSRNVVEEAIINQSKRVLNDPEAPLDILLLEDFNLVVKLD